MQENEELKEFMSTMKDTLKYHSSINHHRQEGRDWSNEIKRIEQLLNK